MIDIKTLVRKNILELKPYSSARDEFSGQAGIFLDANENPFGKMNRYPDPLQTKLKEKISDVKSVPVENIFLGNGSDEIIDLCFRMFCNPGQDTALIFTPTYGMYEVLAAINDVQLVKLPLNAEFQVDMENFRKYISANTSKLIFICTPNNPTGNNITAVEEILREFNGIVVVDEAYIDFSPKESLSQKLDKYPNLVVLQTLSKAWGLAAVRIGIALANSDIINFLNKVKPPYNISLVNQQIAVDALNDRETFEFQKEIILNEKEKMISALNKLEIVRRVFPSEANFLLVEVTEAIRIYDFLVSKNIIVRNRNSIVNNCLRISVGNTEENSTLINALKEF